LRRTEGAYWEERGMESGGMVRAGLRIVEGRLG
jgi:hypothetical protein